MNALLIPWTNYLYLFNTLILLCGQHVYNSLKNLALCRISVPKVLVPNPKIMVIINMLVSKNVRNYFITAIWRNPLIVLYSFSSPFNNDTFQEVCEI